MIRKKYKNFQVQGAFCT